MPNKRGDMTIGMLIAIILGIVVLVFLILGFTTNWKLFSSWFSTSNNVDTIVNQCQVACNTQSTYNYCTMSRSLKPEGVDAITGTCNDFATNYVEYGIAICPAITCS